MIYLAPIGGFFDKDFGILATPGMYGIPSGIKDGMKWAADNQAFTKGFNPDKFFPWLEKMSEYKSTCLFVVCPDVVGNAVETLSLFQQYQSSFGGWPVAFVAQDGMENLEFPASQLWQCLFIGGSTVWKMSAAAIDCIHRAQSIGKHIHIGRVNWLRRYEHFASLENSERFTCDGTRTRFERTKAISEWRKYMARPKQYGLFVSRRDSGGQSGNG
jgi:hypothetical protein